VPIQILIADDNASVRTAMRRVLEGEDWQIIEAPNGREAVAKAEEFRPNLVILDLVMPGMDGFTASREISRLLPQVPILIHTLYWSQGVELEAAKLGVQRVVPKSESSILISAVQDILSSGPREVPAPVLPVVVSPMRRREDKIRELCSQLFAVQDDVEQSLILDQLRKALHQHIEQLRSSFSTYPLLLERRGRSDPPPDCNGTDQAMR